MNEITYLGICASLAAFLGAALARRFPNEGILQSQVVMSLALMVMALTALTVR